MYETIGDDYFGIELIFPFDPVHHYPQRRFVIAGHELLVMLLQPWQMVYELVQEKLNFTGPVGFPVKLSRPQDWIDLSQLLRQGKHNKDTDKLIFDLGGRKLYIRVPSDVYCYDDGELPPYVVRLNVPTPNHLEETINLVVTETPHDETVVMDPNISGRDPLRSLQRKERLSYLDFYLALRQHYGENMDDSAIVSECRPVLAGGRLRENSAKVLPVMLATMLGAEVNRNRACLTTGLMLLDLIENRINAPSQHNVPRPYSFKNVLWHPDLYDCSARDRRENPEMIARGKLGGFFPMAHVGSWEEEFKEDGEYQSQNPLTLAHIKSIVILIDWLCHLPQQLRQGIVIRKLNKTEFTLAASQAKAEFANLPPSLYCPRNFGLDQLNRLVLINFLYPKWIAKRFSSFANMLSPMQAENAPRVMTRTADPRLIELTRRADLMVADLTEQHQAIKTAYFTQHVYNLGLSPELTTAITQQVTDQESALTFIQNKYPDFTRQQYLYFKGNSNLQDTNLVILFLKLHDLKWPVKTSLNNLILNKSGAERLAAFRLIFCDPGLFDQLYKCYSSIIYLMRDLSMRIPIERELIDVLLDHQNILAQIPIKDLNQLCEFNMYLLKAMILTQPDLFRKMIATQAPYKTTEQLYQLKEDRTYCPTPAEWRIIDGFNYGETVKTALARLAPSHVEEDDIEDVIPPALQDLFLDEEDENSPQCPHLQ